MVEVAVPHADVVAFPAVVAIVAVRVVNLQVVAEAALVAAAASSLKHPY